MRRILALSALIALCAGAQPLLAAESVIKKTLDGRCLAPNHPDYWKTKVYTAKPSMEACLKSGGKKA
ncbi:MAG: hypothetical protein AAF648_08850 [Pseudomonadota bacterium]